MARAHSSSPPLVAALVLVAGGAAHVGCVESGTLDTSVERAAGTPLVCAKPRTTSAPDVACRRWACAHAALAAPTWGGDVNRCSAGDVDTLARSRALALVNVYRVLAGVPELAGEPRWDAPAQDCALLAHANRRLSHDPPPSSRCWSERAARASAVSLIANRSAPFAIDPFMEDPGNEATMVHRRWLLNEGLRRIGIGSTSGYTCTVVDGHEWDRDEPETVPGAGGVTTLSAPGPGWVAWPPEGPVPVDALARTSVDRLGWTVQSSTLDLDGARVELRVGGARRAVKVTPLERMEGSFTAIRFVPDGWKTEPGERYAVHVEKEGVRIDYEVTPVACE